MPTLIRNEKQQRVINLDNIDSIRKEDSIHFEIVFERGLFNGSAGELSVIDRWLFDTEKERDKVLKWILDNYAMKC
jgi:hypothetical protein